MTRRLLPHTTLFVLLGFLLSPALPPMLPPALPPMPPPDPFAANYLLVYRNSMFFGEDDTPSRALLITDPVEIYRVHALVTATEYTGHTCGYDWSVRFWASPSEAVGRFSINEACDHYDPQLEPYFQQLRDQPTHFIYNLKTPVDVHPDQVIDDLEERDLTALLLHGPNPHLPHITVAVDPPEEDQKEVLAGIAQSGGARLRSIVEAIAEDCAVEILGTIHCPDYRHRERSVCSTLATVWFEQGADLTGITDRVESLGGRTWGKSIPTTYYDVQFVVDQQDLEEIQQTIFSELEYVADVSRYNSLPPSGRPSANAAASEPSEEWETESVGTVGTDPSLVLKGARYPRISYYDAGNGDLKYAARDPYRWHTGTVDSAAYAGGDSSLALDGLGYPHISYYQGGNTALRYAFQDASGWHVEMVDSSGYVGTDSSLELDVAGFPHISYCDRDNDDLNYAFKDASGWHIEVVDNAEKVGWHTSLALGSGGDAHISYFDWGNGDLKYAYRNASGWHVEAVDADKGEETSLALDEHGRPHISYYGYTALKYAYQDAGGWHIESVADVGEAGWSTSLALDRDGNPHISFHDRVGFDLKYAYHDASGWNVETVDSEGDVGAFASLALDGDGDPHISYYDWTNGDLKYAFRNGSDWPAEMVDKDSDTDAELTAPPDIPLPRSQDCVDLGCIYVGDTIVLGAGGLWGHYGIGAKLSSDQYYTTIADAKICWNRGEDPPGHLPFPLPIPREAGAIPAETPLEGAACTDLVTPDRIGQEDFEHFGIAVPLENDLFRREVSQDQIACRYQRTIDEAIVEGDHLYYLFDLHSGILLKKQVWWRSDLSERLPSPLITREEAEALVEGDVQHSMLVIIHPDTDTFRELRSSSPDYDRIHTTQPPTADPCWVVYTYPSLAGGGRATRLTVVDAETGELVGHTDLQ